MATTSRRTQLRIDGPAGPLEALLDLPEESDPIGVGVVCHPHPLFGGTMQNKVAYTLARAFCASGFGALRFNFRGVGTSGGSFDDGVGEVQDVLAALDYARDRFPSMPAWLSGFSFGAAMAIRAALLAEPAGLISVAPAISRFASGLGHQPLCPWLIVQGDQDELVDVGETIDWFNSLEPGPELAVFPDTEHFFHGRLVELRATVENFISRSVTTK